MLTTPSQLDPQDLELCAELMKKAEIELNEHQNTVQEEIQAFRNLVLREPHLTACTEDAFLLRFLRSCKFQRQKAFDVLRNYYKIISDNPLMFTDFVPSAMKDVFSANIQGFLPLKDEKGQAVFVFRARSWDPSQFSVDQIHRANVLSLEKIIQDEAVQINGVVFLLDLSGVCLKHITSFSPSVIRNMVSILQDSFPCRFKAFHMVRQSTLAYMLYAIVKPFLSSKLKNRIYFHGDDMKSLHNCIPREILPSEFGGLQGPFDNSDWYKQLLDSERTFRSREKYGYKVHIR